MQLTRESAAKARCLPRRPTDSPSLLTGAELRPLPSPLALPRLPSHGPTLRGVTSAPPPRTDLLHSEGEESDVPPSPLAAPGGAPAALSRACPPSAAQCEAAGP